MNRKQSNAVALGAVLMGLIIATGSGQPTERPTQPFMRQKLAYASGVLEGITLEKFDLVLTNAFALRNMSQTNAFVILRNPMYHNLAANFQADVDSLIAAAKARNLYGATAAYQKMAKSCVECHKSFRREQFILDRSQTTNK